MNEKTLLALFAMGCITVLEIVAVYHHIDGTLFGAVIGVIAGLGGYVVGKISSAT